MAIYFITSNRGKLGEVRQLLGTAVRSRDIDLDEIQSVSAEKVAVDKARRAYAIVKKPVIVEDTALYISALNGFPGALIKFMETTVGYDGICRMLRQYKDKRATAESCIVFYDGKNLKSFSGRVRGVISDRVRGADGFGFDCLFVPSGSSMTFAEMGTYKKNRISHRRKAVLKLSRYLKQAGRNHASVPRS